MTAPSIGRVSIAPSILTADFGRLAEQVCAGDAGGADVWHLDVMDGHFVPPLSFGKEVIAAVRAATDRPIEAHLMVAHPGEQFAEIAAAGAHRLILHFEAVGSDIEAARAHIAQARTLGCEVGVAINPETPAEALLPLLDAIDAVVVMLIRPGWGGQEANLELLAKVRALRAAAPGLAIEVDGGVKPHNARACAEAGASILVAGSAVFNATQTPAEGIAALRASLQG